MLKLAGSRDPIFAVEAASASHDNDKTLDFEDNWRLIGVPFTSLSPDIIVDILVEEEKEMPTMSSVSKISRRPSHTTTI